MIGKTQSLTKLPGLPFRQVMLDSAPLGAHKSVETKGFCLLPGFMRSLGLIGAWAGLYSLASPVLLFANLSTGLLSTIFFRVIFEAPQTRCKLCKAKTRAGKEAREQNVADCSDNRQLNIFFLLSPRQRFWRNYFHFYDWSLLCICHAIQQFRENRNSDSKNNRSKQKTVFPPSSLAWGRQRQLGSKKMAQFDSFRLNNRRRQINPGCCIRPPNVGPFFLIGCNSQCSLVVDFIMTVCDLIPSLLYTEHSRLSYYCWGVLLLGSVGLVPFISMPLYDKPL